MYKWTYEQSSQKQQNADVEELQIFDMPKTPLYHYTSREVFWKIMDSETFLARHIMFSNDYKENKIGNEKIASAMKALHMPPKTSEALPFMICFCEKDDLLSQWRGYAKQGIAMEFDFSKGLYGLREGFSSYYCYTIMNHSEANNADEEKGFVPKNPLIDADKELVVEAIASPYAVIYTDDTAKSKKIIRQKLEQIQNNATGSIQQRAMEMIPYIKSNKFDEEKEYRLIFDMNLLVPESKQYLLQEKYTYLETDGVKKPNIRVKFGDMSNRDNERIELYYGEPSLDGLMKEFEEELKCDKILVTPIRESNRYQMKSDEIIVSDGKYQELICTRLRLMLHQKLPSNSNMKVWCDGHLPIRRIVVGPSQDAELMKCSIEEYLKTKYWAKDIKVEISKIPLRL